MRLWRRLWRKRLAPWGAYWVGEYREWRFLRRYARDERRREEGERLMALNALEVAQTRALLAQLDQHTIAALKSVLREEVLPELRGEALEAARAELAEELAKGKERLEDQAAAYREQLDAEVESRVEADVRRATEDLKADFEDTLKDLRQQRQQARQQRDAAEQQLLHLLRQLLDEEGRYLRNAHVEEFDQWAVNQILQRHGWRVRSKVSYSARVVRTRTAEAHWQARAVFWLSAITPAGVEDPEAEEEPAPEVTPDRLALPEGQPGEGV
jgi:hypothetical protein